MSTLLHYCLCLLVAGCPGMSGSPLWAQKVVAKQALMAYYCQPCGSSCDQERHEKPGFCPHCGMPLIQRRVALMDSLSHHTKPGKKRNVAIFIH